MKDDSIAQLAISVTIIVINHRLCVGSLLLRGSTSCRYFLDFETRGIWKLLIQFPLRENSQQVAKNVMLLPSFSTPGLVLVGPDLLCTMTVL